MCLLTNKNLYFVWAAATKGVKFAYRKYKLKHSIVELCDEISKEKNFKLSVILSNGLVKIYQKQVNDLYVNITNIFTVIFKQTELLLSNMEELFKKPKPLKRIKTIADASKSISYDFDDITIDELDNVLEQLTINSVAASEITLREEIGREMPEMDFGSIGSGIDILRAPEIKFEPQIIRDFLRSDDELPREQLRKESEPPIIISSIISEDEPPRKKLKEKSVSPELPSVIVTKDEPPRKKSKSKSASPEQESIVPMSSIVHEDVEAPITPSHRVITRQPRVTVKKNHKIVIKEYSRKHIDLNSTDLEKKIYDFNNKHKIPLEIDNNLSISLADVILPIESGIERREIQQESPRTSFFMITEQARALPHIEQVEFQPEIIIKTPSPIKIVEVTRSPLTKITELEIFPKIPSPPISQIRTEDFITENRQLNLLKRILEWSDERKCKIDDICLMPINRFNISVAFHDLLILQKQRDVNMIKELSSNELDYIEKGSKHQ